MCVVALIPAYNPSLKLLDIVRRLAATDLEAVIVINDGSLKEKEPLFEEVSRIKKAVLLKHEDNQGKGAALKTGLDYAYRAYADMVGVVTADADGQHLIEDALKVARTLENYPRHLVLGVRILGKHNGVPLRNRIGNAVTRRLFQLITGENLKDTQTGLRGIPKDFVPALLKIDSNGYRFELEMLLSWKRTKRPLIQKKIRTLYPDGNKSHFKPVSDSIKILLALFRFAAARREVL